MRNAELSAAVKSLVANILLFILKLTAALASGSLTMLASTFDSFNDIISYFIGYYTIKQAARGPDYDHPFGHRRMEPLASLVIAILAGVLAIEIFRSAFINILIDSHQVNITEYTFIVLVITVTIKVGMFLFLRKKAKRTTSTALDAMVIDSRNDVLANSVALIGIGTAYFGHVLFDDIIAVVIAIYIAYSGYLIAKKNIGYIVGARPDAKTINAIRKKASLRGVKRVGKIRAHYVGDRVHAEIEIVLRNDINGPESHKIGVDVQKSVESLRRVSRAFIHIDYE